MTSVHSGGISVFSGDDLCAVLTKETRMGHKYKIMFNFIGFNIQPWVEKG